MEAQLRKNKYLWLAALSLCLANFFGTLVFEHLSPMRWLYGIDGLSVYITAGELSQGRDYYDYFRTDKREMIRHINVRKMVPGFSPAWIALHIPVVKLGISQKTTSRLLALISSICLALWFLALFDLFLLLGLNVDSRTIGLALLLSLAFLPFYEAIFMGQPTIIVLLLVTLALLAILRNRELLSAVFIALAAVIKIFPAALLVHFLIRKQWKPFLLGLVIILFCQLPVLIFNQQVFESFICESMKYTQNKDNHILFMKENKSIRAVCLRLFDSFKVANALCTVCLWGTILFVFFHKEECSDKSSQRLLLTVQFLLLWIAATMQTPNLWRQHHSMLAVVYFVFYALKPKWSVFIGFLFYLDIIPEVVPSVSPNYPPVLLATGITMFYFFYLCRHKETAVSKT